MNYCHFKFVKKHATGLVLNLFYMIRLNASQINFGALRFSRYKRLNTVLSPVLSIQLMLTDRLIAVVLHPSRFAPYCSSRSAHFLKLFYSMFCDKLY